MKSEVLGQPLKSDRLVAATDCPDLRGHVCVLDSGNQRRLPVLPRLLLKMGVKIVPVDACDVPALNAFLLLFQKISYSPKEMNLDFYLPPYKQ